jgi:formamidopyrimidine-DNA glycosylase
MPELPEVETIRRDLSKKIVGRKIIAVDVPDKKLGDILTLKSALLGNQISAADRVGKLLILHLADGKFLLIHLKMTGQLVYEDRQELLAGGHSFKEGGELLEEIGGKLPNKYTRLIISFEGGRKLFFNDMRRFGYANIVNSEQLKDIKKKFGIEPLCSSFTLSMLKKIFSGKKINIKAALMDQKNIAGIGNIYASEILYDAKVKPDRPTGKLKSEEINRIFVSVKKVLQKSIKHRGTTFSDYVDVSGKKGNFSKLLQVYKRDGKFCYGCGGKIKAIKIAGRSTYFCPKCQK